MKIICIGRNYADHIKELNNSVSTEPVFFLKPETALLKNNEPFYYPAFSNNIHYELEIVLQISKIGKHIEEKFAHKYYDKLTVGIDFTARDVQEKCKEKGLPWEKAKAFDNAAPIGEFIAIENIIDINAIPFYLDINGEIRQQGNTNQMLFSFNKIIAYISQFITLKTGDLIFTGTPAGVGKINIGDCLKAYVENKLLLNFEIK